MCVNNVFVIYVYDESFILWKWLDWKRDIADYRIWVADGSSQSYREWAALKNQLRFPDLCVHKFKHQKLEILVKIWTLTVPCFSLCYQSMGKTHFTYWKRKDMFTKSQQLLKVFAYHNHVSIESKNWLHFLSVMASTKTQKLKVT